MNAIYQIRFVNDTKPCQWRKPPSSTLRLPLHVFEERLPFVERGFKRLRDAVFVVVIQIGRNFDAVAVGFFGRSNHFFRWNVIIRDGFLDDDRIVFIVVTFVDGTRRRAVLGLHLSEVVVEFDLERLDFGARNG